MKKTVLVLVLLFSISAISQESKPVPQINVNGEGRIKTVPDQVLLLATVENKGTNAKEVKKINDEQIEAVVKLIKGMNIPQSDYRTKRVSLSPVYDHEKKKTTYNATQTIEIILKDLTKYDLLMEELVNKGINRIDNVIFQTSKLVQLQAEARKLAMKDAKTKAEDYVSVLGQKIGTALLISDNTQTYYPQPVYMMKSMRAEAADNAGARETLASGEIEITANVSVSFKLD